MAEEIRRFREKAKMDMIRQEREDRRKEGWTVTPMDLGYNVSVNVVVPDLMTILSDDQKALFEKAVAAIKAGVENKPLFKEKEKLEEKKTELAATKDPPPPAEDEEDDEFKEYFKIFSNPDLPEKDEVNHIKKLIADKKSALVRKLVIKLSSVEGVGKSTIFKTLAKKFVKDLPPKPAEEKKVDAIISDPSKPADDGHSSDNKPAVVVDSSEKTSATSNDIVQNGKEGKADASRKRHVSSESIKSNGSSKTTEDSRKRHVSNESTKSNVSSKSKGRRVEDEDQRHDKSRRPSTDSSRSTESSLSKVKNGSEENKENKSENKEEDKDTEHTSSDKKKKKKHKHKDDEDKEGGEKKHKKHKHKEKHKHKDKHKKKDKEMDRENPERIEKKRDSVDSTVSNSSSKSERGMEEKLSKPINDMSLTELKQMFHLQSIDAYVKVKNCKKLYRQIEEAIEARQNISDGGGKRSRASSSSSEGSSKKRQRKGSTSQPPSRPTSALSTKSSRKSRSPSRGLSRSRSRSDSRSPVRYVSRTPSRSASRSPIRSPSPMSS